MPTASASFSQDMKLIGWHTDHRKQRVEEGGVEPRERIEPDGRRKEPGRRSF